MTEDQRKLLYASGVLCIGYGIGNSSIIGGIVGLLGVAMAAHSLWGDKTKN